MNNVFLFSAAFLCGMILFVSGAPLTTNCKIPSDLNIHYEKLTAATIGNKFLMPAEYIPSSANQTLHRGETTCPKTLPSSGETKDRSSCPWYNRSSQILLCSHQFDQRPCVVVETVLDLTDGIIANLPIVKHFSFNARQFA